MTGGLKDGLAQADEISGDSKPVLLTLNAGSSSLKFRLFGLGPALPCLLSGQVTDIGETPVFHAEWSETHKTESAPLPDLSDADFALGFVLDWLDGHAKGWQIQAAAHRIVHGGPTFSGSVELNAEIMDELRSLYPYAPLHQPHNLAPVEALWRLRPNLRQFGCFDTAFHAGHGPLATTFALPNYLRNKGIRRYGFHGLSYSWIAHCLKERHPCLAEGRVVVAHLGNGASLCAMKAGQSIDTTMGLTALDGLPMGTRCGALDPGVVLVLQKTLGYSAEAVEHMLYRESGLQGLSGLSFDVQTLMESQAPEAIFALAYFAYKTAQQIAAMAVATGGMDGLIFTGGIGENAAPVRQMILEHLDWLPPFEVHVIAANEERAMAMDIADQVLNLGL